MASNLFSQVGIGTNTPNVSSALDVESNAKGMLPPRMNSAQRDALSTTTASKGLIIFNTDSNRLNIFDGIRWHAIVNQQSETICENATTLSEFLNCLQSNYTPAQTLGYSYARDVLYSSIDVDPSTQELKGIYSGFTIIMDYSTDPDPSVHAFNLGINTEHVFPQSMGAGDEPGTSDMFNIFPSRVEVNSSRGNCPFNEIVDADTETWYYLDQEMTSIPTSNRDDYSEKDNEASYPSLGISQQCALEPREAKKGDIARALFYYYTIYNSVNINTYPSYANEDFFMAMKTILLQWHISDPVDQIEIDRNNAIQTYQGNSNPFVIDATLAQRMFN
ncbi:endonuclease [Lacinutrix iliipiscaria]|uniref:Endonuclease n=2 Tax=Lacinutrix iliipiscaria TaxID=1230532 RepID=A0ABW5WN02_9FLAO